MIVVDSIFFFCIPILSTRVEMNEVYEEWICRGDPEDPGRLYTADGLNTFFISMPSGGSEVTFRGRGGMPDLFWCVQEKGGGGRGLQRLCG